MVTLFKAAALTALLLISGFLIALILFLSPLISEDATSLPVGELLFAVKLSLITATTATLLATLIGVPAAYALSRTQFPGKTAVDTLLDLPIVLSPVALGTALLAFFSTPPGRLLDFGFVFGTLGIVLAQFVIVVSLMIRLMKTGFDSVNRRYEDVACTLGCTPFKTFWRITLPLSKNALASAVLLCWARAIREFGATVTLAGATRFKTETLPRRSQLQFF